VGIARGAIVCSSRAAGLSLDCNGGVEETVDVELGGDTGDAIGETEDVDVGTGVARRGVTLGVSNRLCLGETDGEVVAFGVAVDAGVAVGVSANPGVSVDRAGARGCSVAFGNGVTDADSVGARAAGAVEDVDVAAAAVVSAAGADSLAGFTNFFDGASVGVLTSDFILARALSASW
jgi:hypothetical protein